MPSFDDLSEEQQSKILEIADKEIAHDKIITEYTNKAKKSLNTGFKKFLSKDGQYSEDQVPANQLTYDDDTVIRVQNNSGQFIERAVITFDNNYQLAITRPQQVYGSNPGLFDVSPRKPDGELDTTLIDNTRLNQDIVSAQNIVDINNHIVTLGAINPNAEEKETTEDD